PQYSLFPFTTLFRSGQFQDMFATFGGAGSTLSLIIVMVLFCKSQRIKKLSQLSLIPGVFGINEPIIFELPIVLNPILLIPFVLRSEEHTSELQSRYD